MRKRILLIATCTSLFLFVAYGIIAFLSRTFLYVDGKTYIQYSFRKGTARDLIDFFQINVSSLDIVRPGLDEKIRWGERVRIIRVSETFQDEMELVDFILEWKRRTSKNLRTVEIQNGYRKKITWTVKKIFYDGKEAETKKSIKKVEKSPVTRLVLLTKKGYPEKMYDLSRAKKMSMIATAYWEGDPQVPGVYTYLDQRIERGIVAVDPAVIPLRSRLYIPGYGYAYASDTGSAIKGKRIDLVVPNKAASRAWEHNKVTVYILEKSKSW